MSRLRLLLRLLLTFLMVQAPPPADRKVNSWQAQAESRRWLAAVLAVVEPWGMPRYSPLFSSTRTYGRMAQIQQVLGGRPRQFVRAHSHSHGQGPGAGEGRWRAQEEDGRVDHDGHLPIHDGLGDDDTVNSLFEERQHGAGDAFGVTVHRVDHTERVARVPYGPLDAHQE